MIFDEIKSRLDIAEYIGRYVPLKASGRSFKACCPFHDEHTPSFHVDPQRRTWRCFGACDAHGDIFDFAMKMHGWDLHTAILKFAGELGIAVPERHSNGKDLTAHYVAISTIADVYHKFLTQHKAGEAAHAYLRDRGVTPDSITQFHLGFCPPRTLNAIIQRYSLDPHVVKALGLQSESGYELMSNRVIFPIRDHRGRICAFAGRSLDGRDPKYINSADNLIFHKSSTLYNFNIAQYEARKQGRAIVVEGYMDAISIVQAGYPNVVAQMGSALTTEQFGRMKFVHQIILATDGDNAGLKSALRSAENGIGMGCDVRVALMPPNEDPDSLIRKDEALFADALARASLAEDFLIEMIKRDIPADASVQQREAAARHFVDVVAKSANPIQQHWHIQKVAAALKLPEAPLLALLKAPASPPIPLAHRPPDTVSALDVEAELVFSLADNPMRYFDLHRILDAHSIGKLMPSHFSSSAYRDVYRLVVESLDQYDEDFDQYVRQRSVIEIPALPRTDDLKMLVLFAKELLLRRIDEQIDSAHQDIARLISERARLLALT